MKEREAFQNYHLFDVHLPCGSTFHHIHQKRRRVVNQARTVAPLPPKKAQPCMYSHTYFSTLNTPFLIYLYKLITPISHLFTLFFHYFRPFSLSSRSLYCRSGAFSVSWGCRLCCNIMWVLLIFAYNGVSLVIY